MDPLSLKRAAEFTSPADTLSKRSRFSNGGISIIDTTASSPRRTSFSSMSPGSPRGQLPSAEVAADFKESLQDLQTNDRYQISNLTLVAKDSTEHAMAIARVLENHIKMTPPLRKLPALYVLDSIVKNVGTPYTIYFGQNLFNTFMDAYTLVDSNIRKAMEAMLKTWKEPIPGSMEARPVFPVDIVRRIENALIKARTVFLQQQQQQNRSQRQIHALPPRPVVNASIQQPWPSHIPTPSQHEPQFSPPPLHHQQQFQQYQAPQSYPAPTPESQLASLFPGLVVPPPASTPVPQYQPPQQQQPFMPPPPPNAGSYSAPLSLAELLQAAGAYGQTPPAQQQQQQPTYMQAPPHSTPLPLTTQSSQSQLTSMFPGLEALFKTAATPETSMLQPFPPPPVPQQFNNPLSALAALTANGAMNTPPVQHATLARPALAELKNDVQLTAASLKIPRPHLLSQLYNTQPSQCATCGRRFGTDATAKARKARHLDSHFRTNRSVAEALRKGVSRNWFVEELDWIRNREVDDADEPPTLGSGANGDGHSRSGMNSTNAGHDNNAHSNASVRANGLSPKEVYVKAPADAAVSRTTCPICQEEFNTVWHDGAQEWVWMDAVMVDGKPYHKSCLDELNKDRGGDGMGAGAYGGGVGSGKVERVKRDGVLA